MWGTILKFIIQYRQYLIGVALALALAVSFHLYVSHQEDIAYDNGFQKANIEWEKKGKEYLALLEKSKADNATLNQKLNEAVDAKKVAEEKLKATVNNKQIEYIKSPESKVRGLDDKFIDLYNSSLGD